MVARWNGPRHVDVVERLHAVRSIQEELDRMLRTSAGDEALRSTVTRLHEGANDLVSRLVELGADGPEDATD